MIHFFRLTAQAVVVVHESDGGIVDGGAAGGVEDVDVSARAQFGQPSGEHRRRLVAAMAEWVVALHPRPLLGGVAVLAPLLLECGEVTF